MITGDKFQGLTFNHYASARIEDDYCGLVNNLDVTKTLVYTHTGYVKGLFEILRKVDNKFVVITHNSDVNVDFDCPDNVRWFTTNVNIVSDKITSIPIGLENDRWFVGIRKKEKMIDKLGTPKKIKNLVYMNHNIATNPKERQEPYDVLSGKKWITTRMGLNGYGFEDYLDNIYNHKFVICPQGNGMDTHRFWETLYMGSIPIVKRDLNNSFYQDMPVVFVDNWEDVTEELLSKEVVGSLDKLKFDYWKNAIYSLAIL